jgi:hypothetical protein
MIEMEKDTPYISRKIALAALLKKGRGTSTKLIYQLALTPKQIGT